MAPFYAPNSAGDLLARYSFIEPLLAGKRVLEIGAAVASAALPADRAAAAVLSMGADAEGIERADASIHHPFVQFRTCDPAQLRPHAFDLVLVADGVALAEDPERLAQY